MSQTPATSPVRSSASARALIAFEGVQKSYDGVTQVVKNLDLEIAEGEFLTLLGPSGSGKTTTLMMLAGFERPSKGVIYVDGKPINDVPTYNRNFGMVFQNYALFPHMTVAQNLAFPLRMHKFNRSEIGARVARALDMVKLTHLADRHPTQLSGGQQQRVALARALVFEPRMVLMDEPLGALDKQLREHMQLEIRELHNRLGLTMLYVTHDQSEALTMSDRVAIFDQGVIQHIGSPEEVYDRPANAFVARFMGENNVVLGQIATLEGGIATVTCGAGMHLRASAAPGLQAGAPVQVLIRPERVRLGGDDLANRLTGQVRDVIYHGDHLRVVAELADGARVTANLPRSAATTLPRIGETVPLSFAIEHALTFPADPAS